MRPRGLEVADIFRQIGPAYRREHADSLSRRAAPCHDRHRALPHGGAGWPRRAVRRLRPSAHRVQQLPGSALPEVPVAGARTVAARTGRPNCCRSNTSTSSSPCRSRSPRSPTRTRPWSTTSCSTPPPRRCARSPPIPSTWAPRSASSPCCTPGARICCITRICTASCPAAACRPTASAGSPAGPGFFLPVRVLSRSVPPPVPGRSFGRRSADNELHFFNALAALQDPQAFAKYLAPAARRRLGGLRQAAVRWARAGPASTSAATRIAWRSPTTGCSTSHGGQVTFQWKDYRHESQPKVMRLDGAGVHAPLPAACPAVGLPAHPPLRAARPTATVRSSWRSVANCSRHPPAADRPMQPLDYRDQYQRLTGVSLRDCPHCGKGQMVRIESFLPGTLAARPAARVAP